MRFVGPFRKCAGLHKLGDFGIASAHRFVKLIKDGMLVDGIVIGGAGRILRC